MLNIVKGYKQGRAVMFYDLAETDGSLAKEKVEKAIVVKMCDNGEIANAKVQWWEGKAIVRCENKQLPLVRVDENGNVIGVATQAVRGNSQAAIAKAVDEKPCKSTVVGKVSTKRSTKRNIAYGGYDPKNTMEQIQLNKSIDLSGLETVSDLFDCIAKDFRVQQLDKYKAEFGKKVKLESKLSGIAKTQLRAIEYGAATYLMNMAYEELSEVYLKWK